MGVKPESCQVCKTFSTSIYKQFCSKSSTRTWDLRNLRLSKARCNITKKKIIKDYKNNKLNTWGFVTSSLKIWKMSMTLPFSLRFGFQTANGWRIAVYSNTIILQPLGNSSTTTGLSWVGDTQEENTQRTIFQFQKFSLPLSTERNFHKKWKDLGKISGNTPVQEVWEPPDFSILQGSPRVWDFGTNSFVQLEHQIISSCSMRVMKTCQIYFVDLDRNAEAPLKGEHHPAQNSVHAMIIPNPVQGWSTAHTASGAAVAECS